jgi:hypothetical protein
VIIVSGCYRAGGHGQGARCIELGDNRKQCLEVSLSEGALMNMMRLDLPHVSYLDASCYPTMLVIVDSGEVVALRDCLLYAKSARTRTV